MTNKPQPIPLPDFFAETLRETLDEWDVSQAEVPVMRVYEVRFRLSMFPVPDPDFNRPMCVMAVKGCRLAGGITTPS